jgi:type I restriction enzyme M protein
VELIRHLIERGYDKSNIRVEAVIKRFGNAGRNSFRADVIAFDVPVAELQTDNIDELLGHAVVLGEVKRDSSQAATAKAFWLRSWGLGVR